MKEDKDQAYRDGFALGTSDATYRRDWSCPYVTGSARFAMVEGYEAAWNKRRSEAEPAVIRSGVARCKECLAPFGTCEHTSHA